MYANIPADTDILVTHAPPQGILDAGQGCAELLEASKRVRPKLHVFGHVHAGYGVLRRGPTIFVNAAMTGADGPVDARQVPIVVDLTVR